MQQRIGLPRRQIVITSASVTSCAVIAALIDQPTTPRENRSIVLNRTFEAAAPNGKWIADFTYVWIAEDWLYVAAVIRPHLP
jgi:transposase InsO family protein